jgi:hypothetical protein
MAYARSDIRFRRYDAKNSKDLFNELLRHHIRSLFFEILQRGFSQLHFNRFCETGFVHTRAATVNGEVVVMEIEHQTDV